MKDTACMLVYDSDCGVRCFALKVCVHHALCLLLSPAGTPEQAALVRSELLLTQRLKELSHELSDASLQQVRLLLRLCGSAVRAVLNESG
jgi:hypothetical protein